MSGEKPREVLDEINKERGLREKAPDEINFGKEPAKKAPDEFKPRKKRVTDIAKPEEMHAELGKFTPDKSYIDDEGNREKRADTLLRFLNVARGIESLHSKKFEAIFNEEEHIREFISNLNEQEFIDLLNGINGIVRGKEKEKWEIDGKMVGIKWSRFLSPFIEDKTELLGKVLEAAKRMNDNKKSLRDIAVLVSSSVGAIHPYANGNGRTSRFIYRVLTEKITDEATQEKLREILLDSGRDVIDVNSGVVTNKVNEIIANRIGVSDSSKNPDNARHLRAEHGYGEKITFNFPEGISKDTANQFTDLVRFDNANMFLAVFEFLEDYPDRERYFVKRHPNFKFTSVDMDALLQSLDEQDLKNILQKYRDVKKEHVDILIDCIENPDKTEYQTEWDDKKVSFKKVIEENIDRIEVGKKIEKSFKKIAKRK